MRREGFELTAGQPRVVTREIDGKIHEPMEALQIDVPEEFVGPVTQLLAARKGRMENMISQSDSRNRLDYVIPGPRPGRLQDRVPDRDPRHRDHEPRLPRLGALGGRHHDPLDRFAGRRPQGRHRQLRPVRPAGAWQGCSSARAKRSTKA